MTTCGNATLVDCLRGIDDDPGYPYSLEVAAGNAIL
jgi:hypothetical protein